MIPAMFVVGVALGGAGYVGGLPIAALGGLMMALSMAIVGGLPRLGVDVDLLKPVYMVGFVGGLGLWGIGYLAPAALVSAERPVVAVLPWLDCTRADRCGENVAGDGTRTYRGDDLPAIGG